MNKLNNKYALRTYKGIGAASAILGATFLLIGGPVASANTIDSGQVDVAAETTTTPAETSEAVALTEEVVNAATSEKAPEVIETTELPTPDFTPGVSGETEIEGEIVRVDVDAAVTNDDVSAAALLLTTKKVAPSVETNSSTAPTHTAAELFRVETGVTLTNTQVAGYDMAITPVSHTDRTVTTNRVFPSVTERFTVSTTDPATLSAGAKVRITLQNVDGYEMPVLREFAANNGGNLNASQVTTPAGSPANTMRVLELPVGEFPSGTVKAFNTIFNIESASRDARFKLIYELIDGGQVLSTQESQYTYSYPEATYSVLKDSVTEYKTKFATDGTPLSSSPLFVGPIKTGGYGLAHNVSMVVPDGFVLTQEAKAAGWLQSGNVVTGAFSGPAVKTDTAWSTANPTIGEVPPDYAGANAAKLSFDTTNFGTRDELVNGKTWNIQTTITGEDEKGEFTPVVINTSGVLRALPAGQGQGLNEMYTGVLTQLNNYTGNATVANSVFMPTATQRVDRIGQDSNTWTQGQNTEIPEMEIRFDRTGVVENYTAMLWKIGGVSKAASTPRTDVQFDVYSLDTGEKLNATPVAIDKEVRLALPNNISGIRLVASGPVTEFGQSTLRGLEIRTWVTPTDPEDLKAKFEANNRTPLVMEHTFSVADTVQVNTNTFDETIINAHTYLYSGVTVSSAAKGFGHQQIGVNLTVENQTIQTKYQDVVGAEDAKIVVTIPEELKLIVGGKKYSNVIVGGKEYTNGTYTFKVTEFNQKTFDAFNIYCYDMDIQPVNAQVADGIYDFSWYLDWSSADDVTKLAVDGRYPINGNPETTKNTVSYTIVNSMMVGSHTRISDDAGFMRSSKSDVTTDEPFVIKTSLVNTMGSALTGGVAVQYLPTAGLGQSTYDVRLTGAVTPSNGWDVYYTTDTATGNPATDETAMSWTKTPADYSAVTAIKYVQTGSFANKAFPVMTLPVLATDSMTLDSAAYTQVSIKTDQYPTYITSSPVSMTPRIYTTNWVAGDESLKDQVRSLDRPSETTTDAFDSYRYVDTTVDQIGNVTHNYVAQGTVTVTHKIKDGATLSTNTETKDVGADYTSSAQVPAATESTAVEGADTVTTRTEYRLEAEPTNANGQVVKGDTIVEYVYVPSTTVTRVTPIPPTNQYIPDENLEAGTQVEDSPGTDGSRTSVTVDGGTPTVTEIPSTPRVFRVGIKPKVVETPIPFVENRIPDGTLRRGVEVVDNPGVTGLTRTTTTYTLQPNGTVTPSESTETVTPKEDRVVRYGTGVERTEETEVRTPIDFTTEYIDDPSLPAGTIVKERDGERGEDVTTTTTTYLDDEVTGSSSRTDRVKDPVNEVYRRGTGVVGEEVVVTKTPVDYETVIVENPDLPEGYEETVQTGVPGEETTTTKTPTLNGQPSGTPSSETVRNKEPRNEIIIRGTGVDNRVTEESERPIPYDTEVIYDKTLKNGERVVETPGQDGTERTTTVTVTRNGKVIDVQTTTETTPPVKEVIRIGTGVEGENVTVTETVIPHETIVTEDPSLPAGVEIVDVVGNDGLTRTTVTEKTFNGEVTERNEDTVEVTPKVDRQVRRGTGVIGEQVTVVENPIPRTERVIENPDLPVGYEEVIEEGVDGKTTTTTKTPTLNDQPNGEPVVTTETVPPVKRVIVRGTGVDKRETEESERPIPHDTEVIYDKTLKNGERVVETPGQDGTERTTTVTVTRNGKVIDVQTTTETTPPVKEVIRIGTGVEGENVTVTETVIPHETIVTEDPSLPAGVEIVDVVGNDGLTRTTVTEKTFNGEVTERNEDTVKVTPKVDRQVRRGTGTPSVPDTDKPTTPPTTPSTPTKPAQPAVPAKSAEVPAAPVKATAPAVPSYTQERLPEAGVNGSLAATLLGWALAPFAALGLTRKRRED